jgi:Exostosin family
MHAERQTFASRRNICEWIELENTNTTGHASSNTTMTSCGEGPQCPALANARFGFHVRGDTYGSNRLIDTLLSGTVPIFTWQEQYELLSDWIDWKMLSYYANVSTQTTFISDIRRIAADQQGYEEKHKHVVLNRDLFDWKTTIPFDTYMYMLSVHLWPALEWERRKTQNVSSPYTALILPKYDHAAAAVGTSSGRNNTKEDDDESHYSYLPFRAFDFQYKTVTCGGLFTPEARSCQECPYTINAVKQVPRQRGSRLKSAYSSFLKLMSFSDYWTPSTPRTTSSSSLALRGDPGGSGNGAAVEGGNAAFCSKSCKWTGTQCIHKTFPL